MCSSAIVIPQVRKQNLAQMPLAKDHNVIKAFASDRADQALAMSILPRRLPGGQSVANAHGAIPISAIAVADKISRRLFPATGFIELAVDPFSGRMRGHA